MVTSSIISALKCQDFICSLVIHHFPFFQADALRPRLNIVLPHDAPKKPANPHLRQLRHTASRPSPHGQSAQLECVWSAWAISQASSDGRRPPRLAQTRPPRMSGNPVHVSDKTKLYAYPSQSGAGREGRERVWPGLRPTWRCRSGISPTMPGRRENLASGSFRLGTSRVESHIRSSAGEKEKKNDRQDALQGRGVRHPAILLLAVLLNGLRREKGKKKKAWALIGLAYESGPLHGNDE